MTRTVGGDGCCEHGGRIGPEETMRIARELRELRGRERTRAVRRYAELYQVTPASVSRWLRRAGIRTRAVSSRRGQTAVAEEDLLAAANLMARTSTAKGGKSMPLLTPERAREILVKNGRESLASVGVDRLRTLLREKGLHRRGIVDLRTRPPRVRIRTSHPNQVHVLDATHCVRFFFGGHGLTFRQDLDRTVYANKPAKVRAVFGTDAKAVIWRLAVIDHTSAAFYVHYYEMPGEHPAATIEFLIAAWREKAGFEFHGVPRILFVDKGIATGGPNSPVIRFAENLGVRVVAHAAGNPAAKGTIESFMAHWERHFEGPLALQPARSIQELNAWAFEEAARLQSTREHSRHGQTRFAAWRAILPEQLRELPKGEDAERRLKDVATYRPVSRRVTTDGLIRFAGREWRVPEPDLFGRHVLVYRDFWRRDSIQAALEGAEDARRFDCSALARDAWGFREDAVPFGEYRRHRDTAQQRNIKSALRAEVGDLAVYGRADAEAEAELAIPRRGTELDPASAPPVRTVSNSRARDLLREALEERGVFDLNHEDWFVVDAEWSGTVPEEAVDPMADRLAAMRLAQGAAGEERTA